MSLARPAGWLLLFLWLSPAFALAQQLQPVPPLDGPVVDTTGTLDAATVQRLEAQALHEALDESGVVTGFVEYVDHRGNGPDVLLIAGYFLIRARRIELHRLCMLAAVVVSGLLCTMTPSTK